MEAVGEILIVPFLGQGHLFPCMELCKHLSSHNYKTILIIPSNLSSSIPSSLHHHHLVEVIEITTSSPPSDAAAPPGMVAGLAVAHPLHHRYEQVGQGIESFLSARYQNPDTTRPVCAVIDVMMRKESFAKFTIPTVSLFTFGACAAAMEYASWKAQVKDMKPCETRLLPGLPEDMVLSYSDLKRRPHRPPPHIGSSPPGGMKFGPTEPGQRPRWVDEVEGSIALLINTCDDLERSFINYVASEVGKPIWCVGPLLPEQYWKSVGLVMHDREIRPNRQSNYTEDEVIQWLDSKPRKSVIYVSFGSEVGPTVEEYAQLAMALEETNRPFIWVIQPGSGKLGPPQVEGYYTHGLDCKVGDRGLIIRGWAPQLLILSHPSTGGFLSHCGWNSTVEAIGRGIPILAWPIRGDQFYDAKLVACHLKVGYVVSTEDDSSEIMVKKDDIVRGIERLMIDEDVQMQAKVLQSKFECGFPMSSVASLDAFTDLISQNASKFSVQV